jgi:hypothetical protein
VGRPLHRIAAGSRLDVSPDRSRLNDEQDVGNLRHGTGVHVVDVTDRVGELDFLEAREICLRLPYVYGAVLARVAEAEIDLLDETGSPFVLRSPALEQFLDGAFGEPLAELYE